MVFFKSLLEKGRNKVKRGQSRRERSPSTAYFIDLNVKELKYFT